MRISDQGTYEQPPAGTIVGRCYRILDLGTQEGEWKGKPIFKRQIHISWELPNELMTEGDAAGKPFSISKFYTASLGEKANLRKDLQNWRGKEFTAEELAGFDPKNVLGKACLLSITMNEKSKARVTGVSGLPKGIDVPPQVNPSVYFSLEEFDRDIFEALPDYFKETIAKSPEYQTILNPDAEPATAPKGKIEDMDDDIPF